MGAGFPKKVKSMKMTSFQINLAQYIDFSTTVLALFNGFFPPYFLPDFQHQDMSLSQKTRLV